MHVTLEHGKEKESTKAELINDIPVKIITKERTAFSGQNYWFVCPNYYNTKGNTH